MLRYFYIVICIHGSFSYDFTGSNHPKVLKVRDNRKHNNVESKVVQLDMESFMSSDDDPQEYEPFDFNLNLNRGTRNDDYYESPINKFQREENADYSYLKEAKNGETVGTLKDDRTLNVQTSDKQEKKYKILAAEETEANKPVESHAVQDSKKKCIFRNMKIPFFSHKTMMPKQHKRRKLECMNCGNIFTNNPESQANEEVDQLARRLKRAYGNVCPNCIRNLLERFHKKQSTNPVKPDQIHNSKEYYQKITSNVAKANKGERKGKYDNSKYFTTDEQTKTDEIRNRQMKELAEMEMRVEKVPPQSLGAD